MDSFSPSTARLRACSGLTLSRVERVRRRTPRLFSHGSDGKWSARQDLHLRFLGPKPSVLLLHYALDTPTVSHAVGGLGDTETRTLATCSAARFWRTLRELHLECRVPAPLPQTTGRSAD